MVSIEDLKKEYQEILQQLSDPELISNRPARHASQGEAGGEKLETLLKRKEFLEKIIEKGQTVEELKQKIEENREILSSEKDPELLSLAEAEFQSLIEKKRSLEEELAAAEKIGPENPKREEPNSVIIEIRAGTGGEEAALFAANLLKMYSKYAISQGWKQRILNSHPTELGGFKEIILEIKGEGVFSKMKYEGGVHRVQRIPETEKSGRIHTSTASVAVLPKPKKGKITINPSDLKVDTYKSSGPGGQYVNKRMTAVRITHLPTGTVITSQTERSLQQNKENALSILEAKIQELKEIQQLEKMGEKRKAQIKRAQRADKIRTYNFPQDRLTDHRIKKTFHNLEGIMSGRLEPVIKTLTKSL